jgi:hypothetical protein
MAYITSKNDGLICNGERISDYIKVTGHTHDENNKNWTQIVEFSDRDGGLHTERIRCKDLLSKKATFKILVNSGFDHNCDQNAVLEYLTTADHGNLIPPGDEND